MKLVKLAAPADVARLQHLLQRCSDYYELHEGWPTPADAGEYELTAVPPVSAPDDLCVLALEDDGHTLHAIAQLLRNYPERDVWFLGLLVVAPELRSRGIGRELLRHAIETAEAAGATTMQLAVSPRNPRGRSFWEAAGFQDTGKRPPIIARSGHEDVACILSLPLTARS